MLPFRLVSSRIDLRRRREKPEATPDLHNLTIGNLAIRSTGDNLEQISIRPDWRRWNLAQLRTGHVLKSDRVVSPIDLDLKVRRMRLRGISDWLRVNAHGASLSGIRLVVSRYHDISVLDNRGGFTRH
jgi:hypothetical protein